MPHKELPPIEDKIQQIFKFLEIADVSQWQGMNVFEAGDADSLYGILKEAFAQVEQQAREEGKAEARKEFYGDPATMTFLNLRLADLDYEKIAEFIKNGGGIGEEIELDITDYQNRFEVGRFKAKITKFIPTSLHNNQ